MNDYDPTASYHGGNKQSAEAHDSILDRKATLHAEILRMMARMGEYGLTCDEAERYMVGTHQGISPRFTELKKAGRIVPSGRTRSTRSGRQAMVYVRRNVAS